MNLTNLPEYISAIVAIIALLISCYQARLSNKQSLFNRRLNIWITVDILMSVYAKNAKNLEHNDEPQMAIGLLFKGVKKCYQFLTFLSVQLAGMCL